MERILNLPGKVFRTLRTYLRILWLRVAVMGCLALIAVAGAPAIALLVPEGWHGRISESATDRLLDIIAAAMLSVTTFSLTVMVSLHRSAAAQFTPRLHQLIRADPTTQNTLATFIGAYVFALVAIVLREVGYYGKEASVALFSVTVLVLSLIVWSFVRWMQHLQTLGSLIHSNRQLEEMTRQQFEERLGRPCLGARPLTGEVPQDGLTIVADASAYVQLVHPDALQKLAKEHDVEIWFLCEVGDFVFLREPLVRVTGLPEDADEEARDALKAGIRANIVTGDERTFDQDPRFGLQAMSEICSKALSPGINDPGSAIDVLNRMGRVLSLYRDETAEEETPAYPRLHIPPLGATALVDDAFAGSARDGAALIEVQIRLQRVLAGLMRHPDEGLCRAARDRAGLFLRRAEEAMSFPPDVEKLRQAVDPAVLHARTER